MIANSMRLRLGSQYQARGVEYGMQVTVSDLLMSDGNSLEHHGVIPNIAVLPTGSDLLEERDPALAFALELAGIQIDPKEAAEIFHN